MAVLPGRARGGRAITYTQSFKAGEEVAVKNISIANQMGGCRSKWLSGLPDKRAGRAKVHAR